METIKNTDKELLELVSRITDVELLKTIHKTAWDRKQSIMREAASKIYWYVGQKVRLLPQYQDKSPYDSIGTVTKVNRVKMSISFMILGTSRSWLIPKTMVENINIID